MKAVRDFGSRTAVFSFCKIPLGLLLMGIQDYDVFVRFFRHLDIEPVGGLRLFALVGTDYRIEKLVTLLPAYGTVSELVQRIIAVNARDIVLIVENQVLGVCGLVSLSASDDIMVLTLTVKKSLSS